MVPQNLELWAWQQTGSLTVEAQAGAAKPFLPTSTIPLAVLWALTGRAGSRSVTTGSRLDFVRFHSLSSGAFLTPSHCWTW
ncbi:hypothetical protein JTB14_010560 [Gonioctena quinquepunctata]|nr:hypothetical protein JTB14_010560 [Gonioctena quinquepunctata]